MYFPSLLPTWQYPKPFTQGPPQAVLTWFSGLISQNPPLCFLSSFTLGAFSQRHGIRSCLSAPGVFPPLPPCHLLHKMPLSFYENSATLLSPTSTHHTQQAEGTAFSPRSSSSFSIFLSRWHLPRVKMQSLFQGLVSKSSHIKYWRLGLQYNGFWANTIQPITVSTHLSLQATASPLHYFYDEFLQKHSVSVPNSTPGSHSLDLKSTYFGKGLYSLMSE